MMHNTNSANFCVFWKRRRYYRPEVGNRLLRSYSVCIVKHKFGLRHLGNRALFYQKHKQSQSNVAVIFTVASACTYTRTSAPSPMYL